MILPVLVYRSCQPLDEPDRRPRDAKMGQLRLWQNGTLASEASKQQ